MNIRVQRENLEKVMLRNEATLSTNSKGRNIEESLCDIRTEFQRDRDRIVHSKAFRRLKRKTQVFMLPEGDHYRTRLTHTIEVSQISRTIGRALRLNEDLVEAIALGHDLGHTPFGHAGEEILNQICSKGFKHYEQSLRVVENLEKKGKGLNLTFEVKDGILNHSTSRMPCTLEGKVVRISDKIAYINHDIDDAIRAKILTHDDIPSKYMKILGYTSKDRINNTIHNLVKNSYEINDVKMSREVEEALNGLRKFMFQKVYIGSRAKAEETKAKNMIKALFKFLVNEPANLPREFQMRLRQDKLNMEEVVCDYVAGMTDPYAIKKFKELFIPIAWDIY